MAGSGVDVVGFADSDRTRAGGHFEASPVFSPEELAGLDWDVLFIAVKGKERAESVLQTLARLGVPENRVETLPSFLTDFDARRPALEFAARTVRERGIRGSAAEFGVYRGDFAAEINRAFPDRTLYLFDTFEGFCERDVAVERESGFSSARAGEFGDTDPETVRSVLPFPERAVFRRGIFPESALGLEDEFCFVSLDADLYAPVYEGLKYFYPRVRKGGTILLHDYDNVRFRGAGEAARRYCSERGLFLHPLWDLHGSAVLRKA